MRAFIIGNGPSLAETPLDLIAGEQSFACNNIHLIYDKTEWRPTHYVRAETPEMPEGTDPSKWTDSVDVHADTGVESYLSGYFLTDKLRSMPHVHELKHCHEHARANYGDGHSPDEWHLPYPCIFGGSLIMSMQIALNQGFDELVLLGCDLDYHDNKPSHMHPDYEHGLEQPAFYANRNNLWAHVCGINYHARRGLPFNVINATIGGDLHLYPRAKLEDIV